MFFVKCSKHTIKWDVEIVNFNTSQLKSYVKSSNINTSQLKPYTFHSLTSLCPPCLTFLSLLSSPGSDSTLNHSLSLLDSPYLNLFSCISPEGWARSWLFLRASVRASVRPPPRGSSKPMLLHHTVWNFRKSPMYFTVLSSRRPQNTP